MSRQAGLNHSNIRACWPNPESGCTHDDECIVHGGWCDEFASMGAECAEGALATALAHGIEPAHVATDAGRKALRAEIERLVARTAKLASTPELLRALRLVGSPHRTANLNGWLVRIAKLCDRARSTEPNRHAAEVVWRLAQVAHSEASGDLQGLLDAWMKLGGTEEDYGHDLRYAFPPAPTRPGLRLIHGGRS